MASTPTYAFNAIYCRLKACFGTAKTVAELKNRLFGKGIVYYALDSKGHAHCIVRGSGRQEEHYFVDGKERDGCPDATREWQKQHVMQDGIDGPKHYIVRGLTEDCADARECIKRRDYLPASDGFHEMAEDASDYPGFYLDKGSVLSKAGDLDGALEMLTKAIKRCEKIERGDTRPYDGWRFHYAKSYKKRGTVYWKLTERDGDVGSWNKWRRYKQSAQDDYDAAVRIYEWIGGAAHWDAAHRLDFAKALNALGEAMLGRGMEQEARALFKRAVAAWPSMEVSGRHLFEEWKERVNALP